MKCMCWSLAILILTACDVGSIGTADDPGAAHDGGTVQSDDAAGPVSKPEQCNGFDDDLDGEVDEGCPCQTGQSQACYPAPPTQVSGICKKGSQQCAGSAEFAGWGQCQGAVTPQAEICGDGLDQDCDGQDLPCSNNQPPPPLPNTRCESFTFGKSARPVDIVWAIDQSGSMGGEIAMVRNNMNAFAGYISKAKADYRVTLVASRYADSDNNQICIPTPLAGPNCADAPRFKQINQHVDSHDALARLMQHIGAIEGFMRPTSVRHFVVVTDDKAKQINWVAFHAFLKSRPGYGDYVFHSIVGLKDEGCVADEGKDYVALSLATGGLKYHICNANWSALFQKLGQVVATATTKFKLNQKPKAGTVTVTYNGKAAIPGKDWIHDPVINQVVLKGSLPADGTAIKVCYQY